MQYVLTADANGPMLRENQLAVLNMLYATQYVWICRRVQWWFDDVLMPEYSDHNSQFLALARIKNYFSIIHWRAALICPAPKCLISAAIKCAATDSASAPMPASVTTATHSTCR